MKRALVVYATKSGCTVGIAEKVAETLRDEGVDVTLAAADAAPGPEGFDAVFVGSGVRASQWHGAAREWLTRNGPALQGLPIAAFSVCLTPTIAPKHAAEARSYADKPFAAAGVTPGATEAFAGWFNPKEFSFPERMIMRALKAKEGDHRDWCAVEAWTRNLVHELSLNAR